MPQTLERTRAQSDGECIPSEAFQAVALALPGGVPQASHVHCVGSKALTVDTMVAQHVAVKAVVVPHLLDAGILKKLLENGKQLSVDFLHRECCLVSVTDVREICNQSKSVQQTRSRQVLEVEETTELT